MTQLQAQQLTQDESKVSQREKLTQLTAPVAGTIQQLAVLQSAVSLHPPSR